MNGELATRAKFEAKQHGGIYGLSEATGINPGVIHRVMNGGNSPTLRRLWKIPKHPPRLRFIVEDPGGALTAFVDANKGEMSRGEYLIDCIEKANGMGEVEI